MRHVFLLAVTLMLGSCCQAPSTQSGTETVALVGQVIALEHPLLTLAASQAITSQIDERTRILNARGDSLDSSALTAGTTIWLSMIGSTDAWHAQEIRVLPR